MYKYAFLEAGGHSSSHNLYSVPEHHAVSVRNTVILQYFDTVYWWTGMAIFGL